MIVMKTFSEKTMLQIAASARATDAPAKRFSPSIIASSAPPAFMMCAPATISRIRIDSPR